VHDDVELGSERHDFEGALSKSRPGLPPPTQPHQEQDDRVPRAELEVLWGGAQQQ
jgi:hypothetical protein